MERNWLFEGLGNKTRNVLHDFIVYTVNPLCTNCIFCYYNSKAEKKML